MSKKIIGFLNLYDSPSLGQLTQSRTLGSTSFLGRFAIMDFALSNFTNSGIDEFSILVKDNFRSVSKHVGSLKSWVNNTKRGRQNILINEKGVINKKYNIDVNCIRENDWTLLEAKADFVVIQPAHIVMAINLRPVIDEHIASGADITVVYQNVENADEFFGGSNVLNIKDGKIVSARKNDKKKKKALVSLNTYVMRTSVLTSILNDKAFDDLNLTQVISKAVNKKLFNVNGYLHEGYARCFDSLKHFMDNSFELLDYSVAKQLFKDGWPIYTQSHDTPPTIYGEHAKVKNSFVANGAIVNGSVDGCIISRRNKISKDAIVKDSIILTSTFIGEGAIVENAIVDKYAHISKDAVVKGTKENPIYIEQGKHIK